MLEFSAYSTNMVGTNRPKSGTRSDIAVFLCVFPAHSCHGGMIAGNKIPSGNTGSWLLLGLLVSPAATLRRHLTNQKEAVMPATIHFLPVKANPQPVDLYDVGVKLNDVRRALSAMPDCEYKDVIQDAFDDMCVQYMKDFIGGWF